GYHPILATRADTGEIIHARMRKGSANTQRGARRFIDELIARTRTAGATGQITKRTDSGFWAKTTITTLNRLDIRFTMAIHSRFTLTLLPAPLATTHALSRNSTIAPYAVAAQAAKTPCTTGRHTLRLIVRRTRLTGRAQQQLWPYWRHHAFLTDLTGDVITVD